MNSAVTNAVTNIRNTTNRATKTTSGKIIYIIIVIIILIMCLYLFLTIRRNFLDYTDGSPWIIRDTIDARQNAQSSIPGPRFALSNDQKYGIEFTYSFWIFIKGFELHKADSTRSTELKHVMHKGSQLYGESINNGQPALECPGVWLNAYDNSMYFYFNTFNEKASESSHSVPVPVPVPVERIQVKNLPVKKWFNVIVSVINRDVDIYINGRLKERKKLDGLPRQNFGDVHVVNRNGFDGFLSRMRYYPEALPYYRIETIMRDGPSQAPLQELGEIPPYLADDYWLTNN
jgi:hypothetical protein